MNKLKINKRDVFLKLERLGKSEFVITKIEKQSGMPNKIKIPKLKIKRR